LYKISPTSYLQMSGKPPTFGVACVLCGQVKNKSATHNGKSALSIFI